VIQKQITIRLILADSILKRSTGLVEKPRHPVKKTSPQWSFLCGLFDLCGEPPFNHQPSACHGVTRVGT